MIRVAIPTGDLRKQTAAVLESCGAGIQEYSAGSRMLRFEMLEGTAIARVFREKDIPVQVALGNYDIGICSLAWIEELAQRFPGHDVVRVRDLGYGRQSLWLATADGMTEPSVRIASEYPNIAETVARRLRLPRYRVFGVAGAAEAYPPEDADLAIIAAPDEATVERSGLRVLANVFESSMWVIANRRSLAVKDISPVLARLLGVGVASPVPVIMTPDAPRLTARTPIQGREHIRVALADGHNQPHTIAALQAGGIRVPVYEDGVVVRRPAIEVDGAEVKVIRPQDMTQQVALGQFDIAVTGRDLVLDHKVQFPGSPVEEVADLGRSRYSLAVIVKDVPAETTAEAVAWWRSREPGKTIRVASEFANIADHFARDRHFGRYSVIPISGASEGFVPDDAEILIEGIETGSSVRANKLTVLERFFESTICVIANKNRPSGRARVIFDDIVEKLRAGANELAVAGTEV